MFPGPDSMGFVWGGVGLPLMQFMGLLRALMQFMHFLAIFAMLAVLATPVTPWYPQNAENETFKSVPPPQNFSIPAPAPIWTCPASPRGLGSDMPLASGRETASR